MAELEFDQKISAWVNNALKQGVNNFSDFIEKLPGVDPIMAMAALEKLCKKSNESQVNSIFNHAVSGGEPVIARKFNSYDVVPHPLDYDWRFSHSSVDSIIKRIVDENRENILLIGTPSIAFALERMHCGGEVYFVDNNESWANRFSKIHYVHGDVSHNNFELPKRAFDVAVIDPPWYPHHFKSFVHFAARFLKQSGKLLVAFPGEGTRPGINKEKSELNIFASSIGLELYSEEKNSISYETPPFEYNAFKASGIVLWGNDWRRADLLTYRKVRDIEIPPPSLPKHFSNWEEVNISGVRIKFRSNHKQSEKILLGALLPGDILPSVSNRHPLRDNATIWTSGNRIYACSNPSKLYELLKTYELDLPCTSTSNDIKVAMEGIRKIIRTEIAEYIITTDALKTKQ